MNESDKEKIDLDNYNITWKQYHEYFDDDEDDIVVNHLGLSSHS